MNEVQQIRRLTVVNAITACLLIVGLALESKFIPAICLLLLTFSFVGSVSYLRRPARNASLSDVGEGESL